VSIAVFDIDGVVADVRHRLHYLDRRPKDWDGFFNKAADDAPLLTGTSLVSELAAHNDIVWLTGRPDRLRSITMDWLIAQGLATKELIMRRRRDYRPARIVKVEALQRMTAREISTFIDDDPDVIAAATKAGFPARLADWIPRSPTLAEAQERSGRT
jgi:hypothetical protein